MMAVRQAARAQMLGWARVPILNCPHSQGGSGASPLTSHMPSFSYLQGEDNNSTGVLRFLRGKCVCNWQSLKECREWRKYIWRNNGWNFSKFTENYKCTDPGSSVSPKARNQKKAAMKPHNQNTTWWHFITKNSKKWYPSFLTGMILLSCMGVVENRGTKNICVLFSVCITGSERGRKTNDGLCLRVGLKRG